MAMPPAWDADSASSTSGQSKRPPLNHQESDSHSESSGLGNNHHHQHHHKVHHRHQRHHPVGRLHHARAPKQPKLSRRHTSPPDDNHHRLNASSHRRALSDAKLSSADSSSANLTKSSSQVKLNKSSSHSKLNKSPSNSKLKRNRSHAEIGKRTRSSEKLKSADKLKRASSTTIVYQVRAANNKSQVQFDLGDDDQDQDDEWVDASGSNSPYLSRKGSINSSNHSAPAASAHGSRPVTPSEHNTTERQDQHHERDYHEPDHPELPSPERERVQHKEYLTSRLLQRVPSHGAPPQMTTDSAQVSPRQFAPASSEDRQPNTLPGSNQDELTSRFVEAAGSGVTSEGSFYRPTRGEFRRFDDALRKPRSVASLPAENEDRNGSPTTEPIEDSALAPKITHQPAPPSAQTSRTQQKLNLQRASSVIEPGQAVGGVGGVVGATPLIGVGGPGYDGGNSRDPRVGKLLERTGLEYFVVRRYTSAVARSLDRLNHLPGHDKSQRIPRLTASTNGKRSGEMARRHARNVSMPDPRRPVTPKRPTSVRTNGTASSFDGKDDDGRLTERLSGLSLVGADEEDDTAALLRSMWDKSMELSASTD